MFYVKKRIPVRAFQLNFNDYNDPCCNNWPDWLIHAYESNVIFRNHSDKKLYINTLEGQLKISIYDYVIEGINGELYPCKPNIFVKSYEKYEK